MTTPSEFIDTLPKTSTRKTYLIALSRFLEILLGITIPKENVDSAWKTYLQNRPDIGKDLLRFAENAQDTLHLSPKTIRLYATVAILYIRDTEYPISNKAIRIFRTRTQKNQPISREAELDRETLQTIVQNADLRLRAEILIAVSSGMRIGEILLIKEQDIDFKTSPAAIYIPAENTKTKTARTVFISSEAAAVLIEWMQMRKTVQEAGKIRSGEPRIFPYTYANENWKFRRCLKSCGLFETDEQTRRTTIHFHLFRKFFLTEFKLAASAEAAEELAGHKGYLSDAYRRLSRKTLMEEYRKAEQNLTVFIRMERIRENAADLFGGIVKGMKALYGEIELFGKYIAEQKMMASADLE